VPYRGSQENMQHQGGTNANQQNPNAHDGSGSGQQKRKGRA